MKSSYTATKEYCVKNVKGSSEKSPKCGNCGPWIDHWQNMSGKIAIECAVVGCDSCAEVGAHVTRPKAQNDDYKTHPYIIPMCRSHNGEHGKVLKSKPGTTFVWASQEACKNSTDVLSDLDLW